MQATHFVDLMRYLVGDIDKDTIQGMAVGPQLPLYDMAKPPEAEHPVSALLMIGVQNQVVQLEKVPLVYLPVQGCLCMRATSIITCVQAHTASN